jgi:hypothetical protein
MQPAHPDLRDEGASFFLPTFIFRGKGKIPMTRSPILHSLDEFYQWLNEQEEEISTVASPIACPTHFPCIAIPGANNTIDYVYYSEFQKDRYVIPQ